VRLSSIVRTSVSTRPTLSVDLGGYGLQVIRIPTRLAAAPVIDLKTLGYRSP
jgi:hypothetical protein